MKKKIMWIVGVVLLVGIIIGALLWNRSEAPTVKPAPNDGGTFTPSGYHGPTGLPYVHGPSGPPPSY